MLFALDDSGTRIYADEASKDKDYYGCKGHKYEQYHCPAKPDEKWGTGYKCGRCIYCQSLLEYEKEHKTCEMIYCCYPYDVRFKDEKASELRDFEGNLTHSAYTVSENG